MEEGEISDAINDEEKRQKERYEEFEKRLNNHINDINDRIGPYYPRLFNKMIIRLLLITGYTLMLSTFLLHQLDFEIRKPEDPQKKNPLKHESSTLAIQSDQLHDIKAEYFRNSPKNDVVSEQFDEDK